MTELLRPKELKQVSASAIVAKIEEERRSAKDKERMRQEMRDAFEAREIHPEVADRINRAVRIAAQQGNSQVEVLTFPSSFCSDGGRRINIGDPEWPSTLEGFSRKAYEYFEKELRPLGFKLHAEIISYPGGMPGDVGFFLKW